MPALLDTLPQSRMRTLVTGPQHDEWRALRDAWAKALADNERRDTGRTAQAEELAWSTWCDWVEENNLNYSKYDPRGAKDPTDAELKGHTLNA